MPDELSKDEMSRLKQAILINTRGDGEDGKVPAQIRFMYRNTFLKSEESQRCLAHLLHVMGYGTKISHPQEIGIHNVAQGILDILGVGSVDMMREAIATWALLPPED